ncbi:MAG: hypothetical protein B7Y02_16140, partial [Rhodobacterales bacterium 17-64-5]
MGGCGGGLSLPNAWPGRDLPQSGQGGARWTQCGRHRCRRRHHSSRVSAREQLSAFASGCPRKLRL